MYFPLQAEQEKAVTEEAKKQLAEKELKEQLASIQSQVTANERSLARLNETAMKLTTEKLDISSTIQRHRQQAASYILNEGRIPDHLVSAMDGLEFSLRYLNAEISSVEEQISDVRSTLSSLRSEEKKLGAKAL